MASINLHWQNFSSTISGSFQNFRSNSLLFDVTLACSSNINEDKPVFIKAHKVILAASSSLFKNLICNFEENSNTVIYLNGIEEDQLNSIIDFVYTGQVNVEQSKLERFLQVGQVLRVEGLIKDPQVETQSPSRKRPRITTELSGKVECEKATKEIFKSDEGDHEDKIQLEEEENGNSNSFVDSEANAEEEKQDFTNGKNWVRSPEVQ